MGILVTEQHFATEQDAVAEIADRGWYSTGVIDFPAREAEFHAHDYDAVVFVLDGTARLQVEDGSFMQCGAGARVEIPAGVVHRESSPAFRAISGTSTELDR